ncbi:MAG: hypothetical protein ABH817_00010 [archaeon]
MNSFIIKDGYRTVIITPKDEKTEKEIDDITEEMKKSQKRFSVTEKRLTAKISYIKAKEFTAYDEAIEEESKLYDLGYERYRIITDQALLYRRLNKLEKRYYIFKRHRNIMVGIEIGLTAKVEEIARSLNRAFDQLLRLYDEREQR